MPRRYGSAARPTPAAAWHGMDFGSRFDFSHSQVARTIRPGFVAAIHSCTKTPFRIAFDRRLKRKVRPAFIRIPSEQGFGIQRFAADVCEFRLNSLKRQPAEPRKHIRAVSLRSA